MYVRHDKRSSPRTARSACAGMSLVEVVIAAAILALVFGGLFASFQLMVNLIGKSKAEAGALALANERLEYIRSLAYDDVGTVNGIPGGDIPQNATNALNGIVYDERVLIEYVDDDDDGEGAEDENGILADYKRVKVEYSWNHKGEVESIALISNIVPPGIETTAGGGTIRVNVFDASVQPVADAEVHLYNDTGTSTIDITRFTNDAGVALFSGAPALSLYHISATKDGFSVDQTYSATGANPNPITPPVSVLQSQVSTMNFQIDALSDLTLRTIGEPTTESFEDTFTDGTGVALFSNTVVSSESVQLAGTAPYPSNGTVRSDAVTPGVISAWDTFSFSVTTPEDTSVLVHLYSVSGTSTALVSDSFVPGNSVGFATGTISLLAVDPTIYPSLALGATLATSNASTTPELRDWELAYTINEPPIGSVPVLLTSEKTIGTTGLGEPVYKFQETHTTDSGGTVTVSDIEWDTYAVTLGTSSYDIAEACGDIPYTLDPGVLDTLILTLASATTHSLRVSVTNTEDTLLAGASIDLAQGEFSDADTTSACGQSFFGGLPAAGEYQLVVSAPGYVTKSIPVVTVDGASAETVTLSSE